MPFEPKPESPAYYWLRHCTELQNLLDPDDERFLQVLDYLYAVDCELLTVAEFCTIEPGNPDEITLADLASGEFLNKYRQAARQAAFYRLCQDA